PLGLPIPHTAIVVERKAQFGETLGAFIQESFLTPDTIVDRVRAARVVPRLAGWLSVEANAQRVAANVVDGAVSVVDLAGDADVHQLIEGIVRDRAESVALAPLVGRALRFATADGRHEEVLDSSITGLDRYLDEHRDELRARLPQHSPWWLPGAVEDRIFDRLIEGARAVLQQMAGDRQHYLRRQLDQRISQLVVDLESSPELLARGEVIKQEVLAQPQVADWVASLWDGIKDQLRAAAGDPDSQVQQRLAGAAMAAGARLRDDPAVAAPAAEAVESAVRYVAAHFNGEIASLVSGTIARWDADETSRRLELLLGPDLQYIRINGTVVGAMAGLAIHAVAQVLG
ncbi:MAG: hypothetical protein QOG64_1173, partial [Acidimicrobiaceae bacterium]|nr:hypothetical protein [Acidimicrobiaceae bacterium]